MRVPPGRAFLVGCAGFIGAAGIVLGAAGAHLAAGDLARLASVFCLVHAATILGLASLIGSGQVQARPARVVAGLLALGTIAFSGDLTAVAFFGVHLVRGLAPVGGIALTVGWLGMIVLALLPTDPR